MSTISETNEGYIFEGWDYEKSVVEDLYARIQNIENLIKNKTEMLEVQDMSLRDIERDDMIINWKKSRLDYLKELKHVLIVGKQETKRQQQAGEGKTSDDEEGSTTLNVYLAGKIPWYEERLMEINEKINNSTPVKRERAKGGGKRRRKTRKKKSKNNVRMRKKTRRKRGANKDDLYEKRKKPLTFGQKTCKSKRDCKSNEICSGGNEKNKGVCVKPIIKYTGELHYDNPRQKLLASLEPLDGYKGWFYDNKTDTYLQYDLKRNKFLSQSNKHPADIKRQRAISSIKRKWTRKFGKKGGKRKKKTRRRKGGNIQTFSSISQLKDFLNKSDVFANGDEPREFTLIENGVKIIPSAGFNSLYLTWIYHPGQPGDNDIKFYQTADDAIWDKSSVIETKTFDIEQLKNMIIDGGEGFKYKYASVGGKRKKKTRKRRKKKTRRKRRRKKAGMPKTLKKSKTIPKGLSKYKRPIKTNPKRNLHREAMVRAAKKAAKKTSETRVDEITKAMKNL